jgi:hypothetical protein
MSSNSSKSKVRGDKILRLEEELSEIIISFEDLIDHIKCKYVYTGEENIPFAKKEAEFRKILKSEFLP